LSLPSRRASDRPCDDVEKVPSSICEYPKYAAAGIAATASAIRRVRAARRRETGAHRNSAAASAPTRMIESGRASGKAAHTATSGASEDAETVSCALHIASARSPAISESAPSATTSPDSYSEMANRVIVPRTRSDAAAAASHDPASRRAASSVAAKPTSAKPAENAFAPINPKPKRYGIPSSTAHSGDVLPEENSPRLNWKKCPSAAWRAYGRYTAASPTQALRVRYAAKTITAAPASAIAAARPFSRARRRAFETAPVGAATSGVNPLGSRVSEVIWCSLPCPNRRPSNDARPDATNAPARSAALRVRRTHGAPG
jgi:hypothetical protein